MEMSLLILVCIHKSYIVYLEILCCADRSWIFNFLSWNSHGKSMLKKSGHPDKSKLLLCACDVIGYGDTQTS